MRVPIVAAALCLIPSLTTSQTLGEAARKQAKQRVGEAPAVRSYSDADLRSEGEQPEAIDATAPPPEEVVRAQLDRDQRERQQLEGRWRALARQALACVEKAQSELDVCRLTGG